MKIHRILFLCSTIALPQLALAELPFSNDAFGKVEGMLDFCARVDPPAAAKYAEKKKALVKGLPEKEVGEARETEKYKSAYASVSDEAGKQPKDHAVKACTSFLESK